MEDQFGSDFITIVDEDGTEYELEVLSTLEYDGNTYLAVIPAGESAEEFQLEVSILKSVEDAQAYTAQVICPIIADGESIGAVVLLSREPAARMGDTELKVAETTASIVGRQMEQ